MPKTPRSKYHQLEIILGIPKDFLDPKHRDASVDAFLAFQEKWVKRVRRKINARINKIKRELNEKIQTAN